MSLKLTVLTLVSKECLDVALETVQSNVSYCLKSGYSHNLRFLDEDFSTKKPYETTERMYAAFRTLQDCNWLWFLDADALVTNHRLRATDLISGDFDLVISQDCNGINNGSFFIRNCRQSLNFLRDVCDTMVARGVADQEAMALNLGKVEHRWRLAELSPREPELRVRIAPQEEFNSYPGYAEDYGMPERVEGLWRPGHFVAHLPGMAESRRMEWLKKLEVFR